MISGAGSGKTTSLVKALAHLRRTKATELRARSQKIACITYTEIAAGEIFKEVGEDTLFHVSTIHSFLWTVIEPFQSDIKALALRRTVEKIAELEAERAGFSSRVRQKTRDDNARNIAERTELLRIIPLVKHFTYGSGSNYANGILGHDDIIRMASTLITGKPLLRSIVANAFPYILVDESQDTFSEVVESLKAIEAQERGSFCVGFFGDPMQKIYATGVGDIESGVGWLETKKRENFRCPDRILRVVNKIRAGGDGLQQIRGTRVQATNTANLPGTARLFVVPSSMDRSEATTAVRHYMSVHNSDPLWLDDARGDLRILVIEHGMAAKRLGFASLHAAFNVQAPDSFKMGYREGTLWATTPFSALVAPLISAATSKDHQGVISCLRGSSPLLEPASLSANPQPADALASLKVATEALVSLVYGDPPATVRDVLRLVIDSKLGTLDQRLVELVQSPTGDGLSDEHISLQAYLNCSSREVLNYLEYIEGRSPYSTQQGIKGAEFERVMVVIDDEESGHRQFSYDKYIGTKPPSETDARNIAEGNDSVFDRTRRLFYVCCSRALRDLVVLWFTSDAIGARAKFLEAKIFEPESIFGHEALGRSS